MKFLEMCFGRFLKQLHKQGKNYSLIFILLTLCFMSCRDSSSKRGIYPLGTFDRYVSSMQDSARALLPDSICAHFPPIPISTDSLCLITISNTLFAGYPDFAVVNTLPTFYEETYRPVNLQSFLRLKRFWQSRCIHVITNNDSRDFISFSEFEKTWSASHAPINIIPDNSTKENALVMILEKGEGKFIKCENIEDSIQNYNAGITFLDQDLLISCWIILW